MESILVEFFRFCRKLVGEKPSKIAIACEYFFKIPECFRVYTRTDDKLLGYC